MRPLQTLFESNRPDLEDDELEALMDHIHETLTKHDNEGDGTPWVVLKHEHRDHNPARPLAIIVHPGDMCNDMFGWSPEEKESHDWGKRNVEGLGGEMASLRRDGYDIVILHRGSCSQFRSDGHLNETEFMEELAHAWNRGSAIFSDNLPRAVHWMIENLHIEKRPKIFLGGAYSDFDHGCLTYIGRAIERIVGPDKIDVSDYTPAENMYDYHEYEEEDPEETEESEYEDEGDQFVNTNKPVQWRPGNRHVEQFDWGMWKKRPPGEPHPHEAARKAWKVTWKNPSTDQLITWTVSAEKARNEHEANLHVRSLDGWKKRYAEGYTEPRGIESVHA